MTEFNFIHDSDPHFGYQRKTDGPRIDKEGDAEDIAKENAELVITSGDLTDGGYDGSKFLKFKYGGRSDQLGKFRDNYVDIIEKSGKKLYFCDGNHDQGRYWWLYQPVIRYIKRRFGNKNYTFTYKGLKFISCSVYPKKLKWLSRQLVAGEPTVIFFHYNLEGPFSDFWSNKKKEKFYNTIKGYNILALLVGHYHTTEYYKWNGIQVIQSAGYYSTLTFNPTANRIDIR